MWNKIYLAVLTVAALVMIFFTYYAHSWFGSIDNPKNVLEGYFYYAGLGSIFLWISTAVLLILGNIILWNTRHAWALWVTLGYFAVFVFSRSFWLEKARYNFQNSDGLYWPAVSGVILIIAAAVVVFFNQYLSLRLNEKMHPPIVPDEETAGIEEI
jgi:hypothetical protein